MPATGPITLVNHIFAGVTLPRTGTKKMNPFDPRTPTDDFVDYQQKIIQLQIRQMRYQACCYITSMLFFSLSPFGFGVLLGSLTNWFTDENPGKPLVTLAQHLSAIFFGVSLLILMVAVIVFVYIIYSQHYTKVKLDEGFMKQLRTKVINTQGQTTTGATAPTLTTPTGSTTSVVNPAAGLGDDAQSHARTHRTQRLYGGFS